MPPLRPVRARGFTLIELMVTVAIIGILAAVAYPAYGRYLVRNNRTAAQVHLVELAQAQAQHMADSRSYAASVDDLGVPTPETVSSKYTIEIAVEDGPPSSYTITATPIPGGTQAADDELSISSDGTRSPGGKW